MNELSSGVDRGSLLIIIAYCVLIALYLLILKVLLNFVEELMSKNRRGAQRSIIDVEIHEELANRHADDKTHTFDAYGFALNFLKVVIAFVGIVGGFLILVYKLNIFFALVAALLIAVVTWQFIQWKKGRGKEFIRRYENLFIRIGGYNLGTLIFFVIALLLVTVGLILLP
jgi:hypothetical protein